jgi:serine protease
MQVNNKNLFLILIIITAVLITVSGCNLDSTSAISGKILIGNGGGQIIQSKSVNEISIKEYLDREKETAPEPEFVADEIIVKYKPGVSSSLVAESITGSGFSTTRNIWNPRSGTVTLLKLDKSAKSLLLTEHVKDRTLREIERLNSLPTVKYAEPNYIYRGLFVPNDTDYPSQWHYPLIKLDKLWDDLTLGGNFDDLSALTVAVLDTGIGKDSGDNDHVELTGIFRDQYDFVSYASIWLDGNGPDNDATDPSDSNSGYHGTHVAGTIGAITNNSVGVAGVGGGDGSGVRIMPLRVLGKNGIGYSTDISQAILYAAGLSAELPDYYSTPPSQKADVINMSFGSYGSSSLIMDAVNDAYNEGVILVAAAGNESTRARVYPAAYNNVISVSAVSVGAQRAYYSNYGDTIDITAPGGDIRFDLDFDGQDDGVLSTIINGGADGYDYFQGTSMAAPHVSGAAAIVLKGLQDNPLIDPTPVNVKNILKTSAIDLGNQDFYGAGLLNVYAAAYAAWSQTQGPDLQPFPKTIRLEAAESTGIFTLKNIGDGTPITVNNIVVKNESTAGFVTGITPASGDADATGMTVQISLDTDGKMTGETHFALLEITYDGTSKEYVNVTYKYIGDVYVVVLDPDTDKIIALTVTNYEKGYDYTIKNLLSGRYKIGASTDRDDDGWIFEAEEAYGFYPEPGYETIINLSSGKHLIGVDFVLVDDQL